MGTLFVSLILISLVALVLRSIIKAKKAGRHPSCGGNCASCAGACHCSSETPYNTEEKPIIIK